MVAVIERDKTLMADPSKYPLIFAPETVALDTVEFVTERSESDSS
jgi:hypothetical protein